METPYKNLMLAALPALTVKLHSAPTSNGLNDVIVGAVISNIVFSAPASGQRQITYDAIVPTDGISAEMASYWDGANLVSVGNPPDKIVDADDTLRGSHTFIL